MFLFGTQYQESYMILSILTTSVLIQTFRGIGGPTLTMTGYPKTNFINSIIVLLINLALNIYLIPIYTGLGAAIATLISMSLLGLIRSIEIWYILRLQPLSYKLIKPFFAIFVVLMVMIFIKPFIMPFHTIISLIIASIIIGISFILLLWLIGFDEDDKQVISALKAMFFKNK
jgi:O-antigen/teichoic acid export membrane protein